MGCGRVGVELLPIVRDSGARELGDGAIDASYLALSDASIGPISCETSCDNAHGTAECVSGQCVTTCSNGYADCDGNPANGCEADVTGSVGTCGSCSLSCESLPGGASCSAGLCTPICAPGFADCDQRADTGCEADLTAPSSCGSCGVTCDNLHGTTSCSSGVCAPSCDAGFADCDRDLTNGCETNLASDPLHCGSCSGACGSNGQICVAGMCQASPCAMGLAECDGDLSGTCETSTDSSRDDCGFCGNVCATPNGEPQCSGGVCQLARCTAGYGDCDGSATTGCEAQLGSSVAHCGACNAPCTNPHGSTRCSTATCVPSCSTGFGDCDSSRSNGCETPLDSVTNCGACGRVCPNDGGTPTCNAGVCGTACNLSGTWALKLQLAATWPSTTYLRAGSGTFTLWLKQQGTQAGTNIPTTVTDCGRLVPEFSASMVNETYLYGYPNALFDETPPRMPTAAAMATLSATSPGSNYRQPLSALLMGVTMSDPINAAWPATAAGLTSADSDMDGKPGVSASYRSGGGYSYPYTGASLFADRADRPYAASRLVFSLDGTLNSCTRSTGAATVKFIDTRIFGCRVAGSTRDCSASQADFLDRNCVNYRLGAASYTLLKVADAATCADVQAALP